MRYSSVLGVYLDTRREQLGELRLSLAAGDYEALKNIGWNLAETGAACGLSQVSDFGRFVMEMSHTGNLPLLHTMLAEYEAFLSSVHVTFLNSVLFVDEEPAMAELLSNIFPAGQYICHFAANAEQALEILEREYIDVLVSDLILPGTGGLSLLSRVREKYPNTVRVVLSAQTPAPSMRAAIKSGHIFRSVVKRLHMDEQLRVAVAEAVDQANVLNGLRPSGIQISLDALSDLMRKAGADFVAVDKRNIVVGVSQGWGRRYPLGSQVEIEKQPSLQTTSVVHLGSTHTVWVKGHPAG